MNAPNTPAVAQRLTTVWRGLHARERRAVALAMAVVVTALLWWVALKPALATLRQADAQNTQLQAQLNTMQGLAAQAGSLKAQPRLSRDDRLRALEAATTQHLGAAGKLGVVGDQVTATLQAVPPHAFALWLADVRVNARLTPTEARLARSTATTTATTTATVTATGPTWQGSLSFALDR